MFKSYLPLQDDHKLTLDELHYKYGTDINRVSRRSLERENTFNHPKSCLNSSKTFRFKRSVNFLENF